MKRLFAIKSQITLSLLLMFVCVSCNKNLLEQFADKNSDDALYYAAQQDLNARNYTAAITAISALSPTYQSQRTVQFLLASAYAGRCGVDFIPLANALTNPVSGSTLLGILMGQMQPTAGTSDCETAESTLRALTPGNSGVFTDANESLQMAIIAMAKVGSILAVSTGTHAGTANPAFDPCHVTMASTDTTGISDADVDQIGTGLTLAYNNLQANATFASSISLMVQACTDFSGPPISDNVCGKTTPGFSATELIAIRNVIDNNAVGIGSSSTLYGCGI